MSACAEVSARRQLMCTARSTVLREQRSKAAVAGRRTYMHAHGAGTCTSSSLHHRAWLFQLHPARSDSYNQRLAVHSRAGLSSAGAWWPSLPLTHTYL